MKTDTGQDVLVDLPHAVRFANGDRLVGQDYAIEIRAALEPLLKVEGDIARLAWHIGNRHTACQIEKSCLYVVAEPVMEKMLNGLGAKVSKVMAPFHPEQGAYHKHEH
ncbi:UNVERIFIED_CONTAM: hypothetical protein GTU68_044928 [Idotea baltica]|nr:hypothetical protein [Idotea baltica]